MVNELSRMKLRTRGRIILAEALEKIEPINSHLPWLSSVSLVYSHDSSPLKFDEPQTMTPPEIWLQPILEAFDMVDPGFNQLDQGLALTTLISKWLQTLRWPFFWEIAEIYYLLISRIWLNTCENKICVTRVPSTFLQLNILRRLCSQTLEDRVENLLDTGIKPKSGQMVADWFKRTCSNHYIVYGCGFNGHRLYLEIGWVRGRAAFCNSKWASNSYREQIRALQMDTENW